MLKNTLIMLQGGHTTVVKDQTPQQIENEMRSFREARREGTCQVEMFYIQTEQRGDNGLCIDPDSIVALVAA
jgi:hypothetical protein